MNTKAMTYLLLLSLSVSALWGFVLSSSGEEIEKTKGVPRPEIQLGGYLFGDSEDFAHRSARLRAGFHLTKTISVNANSTRHWVSQDGDRLMGNGVSLLLVDTFGTEREGKLGVGLTDYEGIGADFSYLASLAMKPTQTSELTLSYEHENVVHKVKSLLALKTRIQSHEFSPSFYQWISESWSFWGRFALGRYSDANLKTSLETSLTYMLKSDPELSLSYGFGYLTYRERSNLYWDPSGYVGHYLISRLVRNIGHLFSLNMTGSIGFSPSESKMNSGLAVGLALQHSPHWSLDVTGQYQGEPGRGQNYSSTNSSINIVWLP